MRSLWLNAFPFFEMFVFFVVKSPTPSTHKKFDAPPLPA
jgi:hypothetical protein